MLGFFFFFRASCVAGVHLRVGMQEFDVELPFFQWC